MNFVVHAQVSMVDTVDIQTPVRNVVNQLNKRALLLFHEGKYKEYIKAMDSLEVLADQNNLKIPKIRAITQQASAYQKIGAYKKSVSRYLEVLKILETEEQMYLDRAVVLVNLSNTYNSIVDTINAKNAAQEVFALQKEKNLTALLNVSVYATLGDVALINENYTKALEIYEKGKVLGEQLGNEQAVYLSLLNMANCYLFLEMYEKAQETIAIALELATRDSSNEAIALGNLYLGKALFHVKKFVEAQAPLQKAKALAITNDYLEIKMYSHKYLAQLHEILKNYESAVKEHRAYENSREDYLSTLSSAKRFIVEKQLAESTKIIEKQSQSINQLLLYGILAVSIVTILLFVFIRKKKLIAREHKLILKDRALLLDQNHTLKQKLTELSRSRPISEADQTIFIDAEKPQKYRNSKLTIEEKRVRIHQILEYMDDKKPYLDYELKQSDMANDLSLSVHVLSEVLNDGFGKNFSNFINLYRIEEAKKLLEDPNETQLKIEAIGYQSGFSSRTSFNRAFKKYVGQTPSEYREAFDTILLQ
ncbi:helix-turn-helix domain-containing protein [Aquimarina sp. U1-2]|uniref:helix-turn-helix domain-containing protein n=1 Tax=Aquimarina sp. U1-2 TaxID=2823141 RepID=UPI001AECDBE6|nr:helix-turn-helix domain-containing protein [Aquimarina sp. U1-2]MBP2831948.1 helix-turn-helix domain-containing protein [Aquimarina sp. U1-2]